MTSYDDACDHRLDWVYKIAEEFPGLEIKFMIYDYGSESAFGMRYKRVRAYFKSEWYDYGDMKQCAINDTEDPANYVRRTFQAFIRRAEAYLEHYGRGGTPLMAGPEGGEE